MSKDWNEKRKAIAKKWTGWKKSFKLEGILLGVEIPLETSWPSIEKEFPLKYFDGAHGSTTFIVKKYLYNLSKKDVSELDKKFRKKLKLVLCARCKKKGLPRYTPFETDKDVCYSCIMEEINKSSKKQEKRFMKKQLKKYSQLMDEGYKYELRFWVHKTRGDYCVEVPYKKRPLKKEIMDLAAKKKTALLDYSIVNLTTAIKMYKSKLKDS